MTIRKRLGAMASVLVVSGAALVYAVSPTSQPKADPRDHLIGWFALPAREPVSHKVIPGQDTLIPVFKRENTYYSVCRGFEVPLKECPEGLEWGLSKSSMVGTRIGFNERSKSYYVIIRDQQEMNFNENSLGGKEQHVVKVGKPAGLLDTTARQPRTLADFVGWYQPAWGYPVRLEIRKEGDKYFCAVHVFDGPMPGSWKTPNKPQELSPQSKPLGFIMGRKGKESLVYNEALKRFELTMTGSPVILRLPLARIAPPPSPESGPAPVLVRIGIPSWH